MKKILIITIIGLAVRLLLLKQKDFWFDEAFSFFLAKNSIPELLIATAADNHPPFYYLLLHFWQKFGQSEVFLRLPSLIFGIISILFIYQIAKEIFNQRVCLITALIFALSPLHVYFSLETRMYSLWTMLTLAGFYYFLKILQNPKKIYFLFLVFGFLFAFYTHYYTIFSLLSLNFFLLLKFKKYKKLLLPLAIASGLIVFSFLPWLKLYLSYPHPECYCFSPLLAIPVTFASFVLGGVGDVTLKTMLTANISLVWRISFLLLLIITGTAFFWSLLKQKSNQYIQLLTIFLILPMISISLVSLFYPIFSPRALIIFSPAFYLITANGLSKLKNRQLFLTIIVCLSLTTSIVPIFLPQFEKEPLKETANFISKNYRPGDLVAHTSIFTYYPLRFYHQDKLEEFLVLPTTLTLETTKKTGHPPTSLKKIIPNKNRLWFVNIPHRAYPLDIQEAKNFLNQNLNLVELRTFKTIEVFLYEI